MNNPDVLLVVDPHADGRTEEPVIRQRLRPQRVHLEEGRLATLRLSGGPFERSLTDSEHHHHRDKRHAYQEVPLHSPLVLPCSTALRHQARATWLEDRGRALALWVPLPLIHEFC